MNHLFQLDIFGKILTICCDEEYITLETLGEMGNMNVKIKEDDILEYAIEVNDEIQKVVTLLKYHMV